MKITIKTLTTNNDINIHNNATVRELKTSIEMKLGLFLSEQTLRFNSTILTEDNKLLTDYKIRDGSEIDLLIHFSKFNVVVSLPNRDSFKIEMFDTNKISELKEKIQAVSNMSTIEQVVLYKGVVAEDSKCLADCGITDGSAVSVIPKKQSSDKNIILRMENGETCTVNLKDNDDVPELKQKIFDALGIEKIHQILIYRNRTINENDKFSDLGITDAFTELTLKRENIKRIPPPLPPKPSPEGQRRNAESVINIVPKSRIPPPLLHKPSREVQRRKNAESVINIVPKSSIIPPPLPLKPSPEGQRRNVESVINIVPESSKNIRRRPPKPFREGNRRNVESVINIIPESRNEVRIIAQTMDGQTVALEVTKDEQIRNVKIKLHEKLELHPDEQKLIFLCCILDDDKTVEYYKIGDRMVINVVARLRNGMLIFFKTMDGQTVALELTKNEIIRNVKIKIQEKLRIHPDEQKLMFQDLILDDDKTVEESGISSCSVINIFSRIKVIRMATSIRNPFFRR